MSSKITVTVRHELSDGSSLERTAVHKVFGDNPRFHAAGTRHAIESATEQMLDAITAVHGPQELA